MTYYENIAILEPTLADEDVEAVSEKIKNFITKGDGEILKEDRLGRRSLAYELNNRTQGYYILYIFKALPSFIKKLEDFYKLYDPVFKFMVLKLGEKQVSDLMDELKKSAEPVAKESTQEV